MEFEQGDLALCTVDKIIGTTVFVNIEGTQKRGTIILSEIAAGRIRNLRDYVVPKKTIVCKVLRILPDNIELSLRRVSLKEQKEILEQNKTEKNYIGILKSVLKEKTPEIIEKISGKVYDFLQESKQDSKELEKLIGKENSKKILEILNSQKEKRFSLKKTITFYSTHSDGLQKIKEILGNIKEAEIKYLAAGKYSIKMESTDIKLADKKLSEIGEDLQKITKENEIEFFLK